MANSVYNLEYINAIQWNGKVMPSIIANKVLSNDGTLLKWIDILKYNGNTGIPTSTLGLSIGDIWCDIGAGNVIKMV
jgi:hypothetical protein